MHASIGGVWFAEVVAVHVDFAGRAASQLVEEAHHQFVQNDDAFGFNRRAEQLS